MERARRLARTAERGVEKLVGRRGLARFARFLTNEVRRDGPNCIEANGEQLVQRVVLDNARNPVIFDVGAHYGEWSESLIRLAGDRPLRLHAFEPAAFSYKRLSHRLEGYAVVERAGLSDRSRQATLHIPHEGAGSSSVVPFQGHGRAVGAEEIRLVTLDHYCTERGIDRITLLKTDAEGHDLAVLCGGTDLLEDGRIDVVQFEYNSRWIDSRAFLADAFALLDPYGYRIGKVTPAGIEFYHAWHVELETFREGNYIACRPDWLDRFPRIQWWNG